MSKKRVLLSEKALAWLVRFQNRAEMDLITEAAALCGITKNAFIARSAEVAARKLLGMELGPVLTGFTVAAAPRSKEETAA